eukprot:11220207-Lingulodinium_polyedra.AAC.1
MQALRNDGSQRETGLISVSLQVPVPPMVLTPSDQPPSNCAHSKTATMNSTEASADSDSEAFSCNPT